MGEDQAEDDTENDDTAADHEPLLVAVIIITLALVIRTPLENILQPALDAFDKLLGMHPHEGTVVYAHFFPHWLLIGLFTALTGFTILNGLLGIKKFWNDMKTIDEKNGNFSKPRLSG